MASDYPRGEMDISEQVATFDAMMALTKWGSLALVVVLTFFILLFCTAAGFFGAAGTAVVLTALGVLFLRDKKDGGH